MKKATMEAIVNYLNEQDALPEARAEIQAELNKNAEKADANRALYDAAKGVVMDALTDTPVTIQELYEALEGDLPEGFTKGKLQYAITRLWNGEIAKVEGNPNGYRKA